MHFLSLLSWKVCFSVNGVTYSTFVDQPLKGFLLPSDANKKFLFLAGFMMA